jgi:hypothetical protein
MAKTKPPAEDLAALTDLELEGLKELQDEEDELAAAGDEDEQEEAEAEATKSEKAPEKATKPEKEAKKAAKVEPETAETAEEAGEEPDEGDEEGQDEEKAEGEADEAEDEDESDEEEGEEGDEDEGDGDADEEEEQEQAAKAPAWQLTAKDKARLEEIDKQLDEIATKFDDGEMTAAEMRAAMKPLQKEQRDLDRKMTLSEVHQSTAHETWYNQTIPAFLSEHTEYKPGSHRFKLLDTAVRELQAENPGNETDPRILVVAHQRVQQIVEELGGGKAPKRRPKPKADNDAEQRESPPTLANVPASDITEARRGNEFAHLDRLNGVAYEKAVQKLQRTNPEAYERYLRQA